MRKLLFIFAFALIVSGCEKTEVAPQPKICKMYKFTQMRIVNRNGLVQDWKYHGTMVYNTDTYYSNDCMHQGKILPGSTLNDFNGYQYTMRYVVRNIN